VNAASQPYTLKVMTIVALIFTPFVLGYQAWSYVVFARRIHRPGAVPQEQVTNGGRDVANATN